MNGSRSNALHVGETCGFLWNIDHNNQNNVNFYSENGSGMSYFSPIILCLLGPWQIEHGFRDIIAHALFVLFCNATMHPTLPRELCSTPDLAPLPLHQKWQYVVGNHCCDKQANHNEPWWAAILSVTHSRCVAVTINLLRIKNRLAWRRGVVYCWLAVEWEFLHISLLDLSRTACRAEGLTGRADRRRDKRQWFLNGRLKA